MLSHPRAGTDDATGRLTFSGASRPVMAGRLASDSAAGMTARGCERSEKVAHSVWAGHRAGWTVRTDSFPVPLRLTVEQKCDTQGAWN